jgi:hypothetical protein
MLIAPAAAGAAPVLQISPTFEVRYDSNVARSSDEIARQRGIRPNDWRFTPWLNVDLEKPVGNQTLFLVGDVGYDFYARNKRLNRERILLDGGAHLQFSRCTGTVHGSLAIHQSDLSELIDAAPAKNTEHIRTVGLDAKCGGPIGLTPSAGVSRTWGSNSATIRKISDYTMTQGHAGLGYARPTLGELSVIVSARHVHYPHREGVGLSDHFNVFSIGGQYSREIGSRFQGSVSLNRTTVDSGAGFPKFTGLTSSADLSILASDNLRAHVQWSRDVQPVGLGFGDFAIDNRLSGNVDYALSPRLTLSGGAGLIRRNIRGESMLDVPQLNSERRVYEYARLTYQRSARTSLALDVRHEQRDADPATFNYHSTSVGMVFRMTF